MCRCEEDVKMRRCKDEKMTCVVVTMRRCEDEKMIYRPPLLEEPFAQTLSGKKQKSISWLIFSHPDVDILW